MKTPKKPIFNSPLQLILQKELGSGNTILEIGEWPPKCRKLVILTYPFKRKYALVPGLTFEKTNDPHYWKAEYNWQIGPEEWDCLACGF